MTDIQNVCVYVVRLLDMLNYRGYDIEKYLNLLTMFFGTPKPYDPFQEVTKSKIRSMEEILEEFQELFDLSEDSEDPLRQQVNREFLETKVVRPSDGQKLLIFFAEPAGGSQVTPKDLRLLTDRFRSERMIATQKRKKSHKIRVILILRSKLSAPAQKSISSLAITNYLEVWKETQFRYSPIRHIFAPKFRILSDKETGAILKPTGKYNYKELPIVYTSDMAAKYIEAKEGDTIETVNPITVGGLMISRSVEYCSVQPKPHIAKDPDEK